MSYDELEEAKSAVYQIKMKRAKAELFADLEILYEGYMECGTEIEGDVWRPCVVDFLGVATSCLEINTEYQPKHMTQEDWAKECVEMFENAHDVMDGLRGRRLNDHYPADYYERG